MINDKQIRISEESFLSLKQITTNAFCLCVIFISVQINNNYRINPNTEYL